MKKRLLSMLLVFCMLFSISVTSVSAETETDTDKVLAQTEMLNTKYEAMETKTYDDVDASVFQNMAVSTVDFDTFTENEPNDLPSRADLIYHNCMIVAEAGNSPLDVDTDLDHYGFDLDVTSTISVAVLADNRKDLAILLVDDYGNAYAAGEYLGISDGYYAFYMETTLSPGTYYIAIWDKNDPSYYSTITYAVALQVEEHAPVVRNPFTDVREQDYFYDPVLWAVENGITSGKSATTFGPNDICTRGDVVTFLWRAAGCPTPLSSTCNFTDVGAWNYYYDAVRWAVEVGITTGTSPTTFAPEKQCTRADVATFLWRAEGCPTPSNTRCNFYDVSPEGYYYKAVLWAVENGITAGTSDHTFEPYAQCTRGQIVTFLYRAY